MVAPPADIPLTPPAADTEAIAALLLLQTPDGVASVRVTTLLMTTVELPDIAATVGAVLTVTAGVVATTLPQLLVAVSVYIPADAETTVIAPGFWLVDVNPLGPLQEYEVASAAVPVKVSDVPTHTVVADAVAVTDDGTVVIVNAAVASVLPHMLVAVSVYTPADSALVANAVGFRSVEVKPSGPLHE